MGTVLGPLCLVLPGLERDHLIIFSSTSMRVCTSRINHGSVSRPAVSNAVVTSSNRNSTVVILLPTSSEDPAILVHCSFLIFHPDHAQSAQHTPLFKPCLELWCGQPFFPSFPSFPSSFLSGYSLIISTSSSLHLRPNPWACSHYCTCRQSTSSFEPSSLVSERPKGGW